MGEDTLSCYVSEPGSGNLIKQTTSPGRLGREAHQESLAKRDAGCMMFFHCVDGQGVAVKCSVATHFILAQSWACYLILSLLYSTEDKVYHWTSIGRQDAANSSVKFHCSSVKTVTARFSAQWSVGD